MHVADLPDSCRCCGGSSAAAWAPAAWSPRQADHAETHAGSARAEVVGYRYGVALQGVLRNFYGTGGIEVRFDRQGRLAVVGLRHTRGPATTSDGDTVFRAEACDCACHGRPLTGPDRSRANR